MKAQIIEDFYTERIGMNKIIVYHVFKGNSLLKTFRGKTGKKRAKTLANKINKGVL